MVLLQLVERGHTVVAACRFPQKAAELQALTNTHPDTLKLVALDVLDAASIDVRQYYLARTKNVAICHTCVCSMSGTYTPGMAACPHRHFRRELSCRVQIL